MLYKTQWTFHWHCDGHGNVDVTVTWLVGLLACQKFWSPVLQFGQLHSLISVITAVKRSKIYIWYKTEFHCRKDTVLFAFSSHACSVFFFLFSFYSRIAQRRLNAALLSFCQYCWGCSCCLVWIERRNQLSAPCLCSGWAPCHGWSNDSYSVSRNVVGSVSAERLIKNLVWVLNTVKTYSVCPV